MSPAEFGLLSLLLRRRNVPLSKEAILVELFGPGHGRDGRQVDVFVARLCRTLRGAGVEDAIVAVAGRGYAVLDERAGCAGGGQPRADREVMAA